MCWSVDPPLESSVGSVGNVLQESTLSVDRNAASLRAASSVFTCRRLRPQPPHASWDRLFTCPFKSLKRFLFSQSQHS